MIFKKYVPLWSSFCGAGLLGMDMGHVRSLVSANSYSAELDCPDALQRELAAKNARLDAQRSCIIAAAPYLAGIEFTRAGQQPEECVAHAGHTQLHDRWCLVPGAHYIVNVTIWRADTSSIMVISRAFYTDNLLLRDRTESSVWLSRLMGPLVFKTALVRDPESFTLSACLEGPEVIVCTLNFMNGKAHRSVQPKLSLTGQYTQAFAAVPTRANVLRAVRAINTLQTTQERSAINQVHQRLDDIKSGLSESAELAQSWLGQCPAERRVIVAEYFGLCI